jgi:lambda family phage portal protein
MRRQPLSLAKIWQDLRSDFRAGKESRFTSRLSGTSPSGSGADYHYRNETQFLHMMERARNYQRNDPIVGQGVRRLVANIVQDGFRLDINTGDASLDTDLKAMWAEWACNPDACHSEGEFTFSQMEQIGLSSVVVDGDVFALPLLNGSVQMVEAHRCRTPRSTSRNVVHGVLMDDAARRMEYWFTKEDLTPNQALVRVSDILPYKARDPKTGERQVFHLYQPYRFSQRRGVTALAPVSDTVGMHDDIQFATLVKSQMASLIAILHERGPDWRPGADQQKGDREQETIGGYTRTIEGVSAGLEIFGDVDEKLSAFSPSIPSPEFFPHAMMILTFIAVNLDMPVHVLLLDPSNTNFSGWRGAIDQARLRFKQIQRWYAEHFHSPIYRWKLSQWAARNPAIRSRLEAATSPNAHRWNPPTFPYIEPLTDASADLLQQRNALNSPRRIHGSRGRDWEEVAGEIVADNAMAITKALEAAQVINTKFPDAAVHWRELISLPTPDGVQIALGQPQQEQPTDNKPTNKP